MRRKKGVLCFKHVCIYISFVTFSLWLIASFYENGNHLGISLNAQSRKRRQSSSEQNSSSLSLSSSLTEISSPSGIYFHSTLSSFENSKSAAIFDPASPFLSSSFRTHVYSMEITSILYSDLQSSFLSAPSIFDDLPASVLSLSPSMMDSAFPLAVTPVLSSDSIISGFLSSSGDNSFGRSATGLLQSSPQLETAYIAINSVSIEPSSLFPTSMQTESSTIITASSANAITVSMDGTIISTPVAPSISQIQPMVSSMVITPSLSQIQSTISSMVITPSLSQIQPMVSSQIQPMVSSQIQPMVSSIVITPSLSQIQPMVSSIVITPSLSQIHSMISSMVITPSLSQIQPMVSSQIQPIVSSQFQPMVSTMVITPVPDSTTNSISMAFGEPSGSSGGPKLPVEGAVAIGVIIPLCLLAGLTIAVWIYQRRMTTRSLKALFSPGVKYHVYNDRSGAKEDVIEMEGIPLASSES